MNMDAVFWGAILSAVLSAVIVVYLAFKAKALMNRDAESHKK
jgi:hypothetical protein